LRRRTVFGPQVQPQVDGDNDLSDAQVGCQIAKGVLEDRFALGTLAVVVKPVHRFQMAGILVFFA
jgi:hypothetical protein